MPKKQPNVFRDRLDVGAPPVPPKRPSRCAAMNPWTTARTEVRALHDRGVSTPTPSPAMPPGLGLGPCLIAGGRRGLWPTRGRQGPPCPLDQVHGPQRTLGHPLGAKNGYADKKSVASFPSRTRAGGTFLYGGSIRDRGDARGRSIGRERGRAALCIGMAA